MCTADYSSGSEPEGPPEGDKEELASLAESWSSKGGGEEVEHKPSLPVFSRQELLRRYHLKKHVERLESAVQKKKDALNSLR